FCVARRRFAACRSGPDHFRTNLVELPVAPFLWALASKLRADVVELVQTAIPELVFNVGADDAGSVFRPEGERVSLVAFGPSSIFPGKHFLGDNIGFLTNTAGEEFRALENRSTNFLEVVGAKHIPRRRLHEIPQRRVRRQQVSRSSNSFDHFVLSLQLSS